MWCDMGQGITWDIAYNIHTKSNAVSCYLPVILGENMLFSYNLLISLVYYSIIMRNREMQYTYTHTYMYRLQRKASSRRGIEAVE